MEFQLNDLIINFPNDQLIGNKDAKIRNVVPFLSSLSTNCEDSASWVNDKNSLLVAPDQIQFGLLLLSPASYDRLKNSNCNFLITENPRSAFAQLINLYFKSERPARIENTAIIHESVILGTNCYIGHQVVIEANCRIGNNTTILHHSVILENTIIGNHVTIGCNNTIGNYGFGYEKNEQGDFQLMEHLGSVVIHDHVEIHNNTCIDRGVLGTTEIHENVKIDNHVHIAHGVSIGRNSLIIAHAMLGGSVRIGENTWIAPSTAIKNQIKIANNTLTGIGAVVLKDTEENAVFIGNPATTMSEYKRWSEIRKKIMKDQEEKNSQ